jgi:WD40 repeat protein
VSVDGHRIVAGSDDKTVKVWDAMLGDCVQTLSGHSSGVNSLCMSVDGHRIVSESFDS